MSSQPLSISIITACRNSEAVIGHCIESVLSQDYPSEHIIVDGCSSDNTLAIVRRYSSRIARVISEPDQGMYDAMNKGIAAATGDLLGILNSDDYYAHEGVLSRVAGALESSGADSCYGDLVYVDPRDTSKVVRRWKSRPYERKLFLRGWMPPHPTFFVRRAVYEKLGSFRLDLGTAADYELMLRFLMKHGISTCHIPEVLVVMRTGGAAGRSLFTRLRANRADKRAWKVNGLKPRPWTIVVKPLSKMGQFLFRAPKSGLR